MGRVALSFYDRHAGTALPSHLANWKNGEMCIYTYLPIFVWETFLIFIRFQPYHFFHVTIEHNFFKLETNKFASERVHVLWTKCD